MLQLLYCVIFGEMFMILSFLFKTPIRKLGIITLDWVKRGRGPVVVKTAAATLAVVLASSLYSINNIRRRTFEAAVVNPTDQVLISNHILEASLMGFVLFLSLMIDRLHHHIRELRLLRKTMRTAKKQSRSFENGKRGSAEERKALIEEIATLKPRIEKLESECEEKASQIKALEALEKQSEGFLREYESVLAYNESLRSQLESIDQIYSHLDNKKSM